MQTPTTHLFKTLPESYLDGLASEVDAVITDCCQRIVGFPFTETMMLQLSLPVRLGGLGIPSAQRLAPVASLVGGMAFWKFGLVRPAVPDTLLAPSAVWFPVSLLEKVCKYVPAACAIPRLWLANHQMPPETSPRHLKLVWWSTQVALMQHQELQAQSRGRDLVRLECQKQPHVGLWLQAMPARTLWLEFTSAELRVLLKWWLGKELISLPENDSTTLCPFCSAPTDCYGDHFVCCKRVEFHSRHLAVVSSLTKMMDASGLRVANEVTVSNKKRPADIFVSHWSDNGPLAVDVTVTHPLSPSLGMSVSAARSALEIKEQRKVQKSSDICTEVGLEFAPFALSTFGELGRRASDILSTVVDLYAARHDLLRSLAAFRLRQLIQVALMRSVAKRLLIACQAKGEGEGSPASRLLLET